MPHDTQPSTPEPANRTTTPLSPGTMDRSLPGTWDSRRASTAKSHSQTKQNRGTGFPGKTMNQSHAPSKRNRVGKIKHTHPAKQILASTEALPATGARQAAQPHSHSLKDCADNELRGSEHSAAQTALRESHPCRGHLLPPHGNSSAVLTLGEGRHTHKWGLQGALLHQSLITL